MIEVIVSLKVSDVIFFLFKDGYGYNIVMILQEFFEIYFV